MRKRFGIIIFIVICMASFTGAGGSSIALDRSMTPQAIPGSIVDIDLFIEINISESTSGFIIKEYFPGEWEIIGSTHTCVKDNSENSLRWLFLRGNGNEPYCSFSNCYNEDISNIDLIYKVKIDNASLGNFNFTNVLLTTEGLKNIASADIIVTNDANSYSPTTPSSSGGGGGGGSNPNSNSVYISRLILGGNIIDIPSGIDDYLYKLEMFAKEDIYSLSLSINYPSKSPYGTGEPPGEIIKFLRVNPSRPSLDNELESVGIYFKIEKDYFSGDSNDRDSIKMYRFVEPYWQMLDTIHIVEDDEFAYFKAYSPGFSYFAIVNTGENGNKIMASEQIEMPTVSIYYETNFISLKDITGVNLKEAEKKLSNKIIQTEKKYTYEESVLKIDNKETKGFPLLIILFFSLLFLLVRSVIKDS